MLRVSMTEEERTFLQTRIALFAKIVFWLDVAFTLLLAYLKFFVPELENRDPVTNLLTGATITVVLGLLWLLTSRGRLNQTALALADAVPMAAMAVAIGVSGYVGWDQESQRYGVTVAAMMLSMARVLVVPSTWRRTLVLSLLWFPGNDEEVAPRVHEPRLLAERHFQVHECLGSAFTRGYLGNGEELGQKRIGGRQDLHVESDLDKGRA
jgi:hypothetical protein